MEESWSSSFGSSAPARDDMRMARGLCPSRGDREQRAKQRVGRLSASSATTSASDRAPEHVAHAPQVGSHGECCCLLATRTACARLRGPARACADGFWRFVLARSCSPLRPCSSRLCFCPNRTIRTHGSIDGHGRCCPAQPARPSPPRWFAAALHPLRPAWNLSCRRMFAWYIALHVLCLHVLACPLA